MKRIIPFILIVLLFASCEEYYEPELDNIESMYVIDGLITTELKRHSVRISMSNGRSSENKKHTYVHDAKVYIEEPNGRAIKFIYKGNGVYTSKEAFAAQIGTTYVLRVLVDDLAFKSAPVTPLPCPEVDSISGNYFSEIKLEESEAALSGGVREERVSGIQINVSSITQNSTPYYRYLGHIVFQSNQCYPSLHGFDPIVNVYIYRNFPIAGIISLGNATQYSNQNISQLPFYSVKTNMLYHIEENPAPDIVGSRTDFEQKQVGMFVRIDQYSLSADEYKFWKALNRQQTAENFLFSPIEEQVPTNIKCITDTTTSVLGFFCISDVKSGYQAFSLQEHKQAVVSYPIEKLPYSPNDTTLIYYYYDYPSDYINFIN